MSYFGEEDITTVSWRRKSGFDVCFFVSVRERFFVLQLASGTPSSSAHGEPVGQIRIAFQWEAGETISERKRN